MSSIPQAVVISLRSLRRNVSFSMLAILYLALGIGGNTAIFSVVNAALLKPLPYEHPEELALILDRYVGEDSNEQIFNVSPTNYFARKTGSSSFQVMGAIMPLRLNLTGAGDPEQVPAAAISHDLLPTLGVAPSHGRGLLDEEDRPGAAANVVLLSHGFWQRRFGADEGVLGQTLMLNGEGYTVVGILPPGFRFILLEADVWVPLRLDPGDNTLAQRRFHDLFVVARLQPRISLEQAQAELRTIDRRLNQEFPDTNTGWDTDITFLRDRFVRNFRRQITTLQFAAFFVLLIACTNLANLLLARVEEQRGEIGIRMALGASRTQLAERFLVEGLILALIGGAVGVLATTWTLRPLTALSPLAAVSPFFRHIGMDLRVLGFTLLLSVLAGVTFGLLPVVRGWSPDIPAILKEGRSRGGGVRRHRLLNSLTVFEVAVAMILLVGAGLMFQSLRQLHQVDPGFRSESSMKMQVTLPTYSYPQGHQRQEFVRRILERLETLPRVGSASVTSSLPLSLLPRFGSFTLEGGRVPSSTSELLYARYYLTSPEYLETMGIPLFQGRYFSTQDHAEAAGVVAVSRTMAELYWPGENPIGKRLKRGRGDSTNPWLTVVGVVEDVRDAGLAVDIEPVYYLPYAQHAGTAVATDITVVIRADGSLPPDLAEAAKQQIWAVDRALPVVQVSSLDELVSGSLTQARFSSLLLSLFAAQALLLAIVGIYGIMSYFVGHRRHEIAIRMAVGARAEDVLRLVMNRGMLLTAIGLILGLAGAVILTRFLGNQLYEVSPTDPLTILGVGLILAAVAAAANFLPARRAMKVDPITVLRNE